MIAGNSLRSNTVKALKDPILRKALRHATGTFALKRADAVSDVDFENLRERASMIRLNVSEKLPEYVDRFTQNASKAGAHVILAKNSETAVQNIADILKKHGISRVVKAKSMVTEEIRLNDYLEKVGINAVETDLGEYIIQVAREHPSHIIVPAIHKTRQQVGDLFARKLGCAYSEDPAELTKIAKKVLREEFLNAKAGISGANFAVADSGSIVLFSNEGNIRMCTSMPPLHIAVVSIDKIIPSMSDLPTFMRILPRSATGQTLTSYMSVITGTRKSGESTGAADLYIILLDNGRSEIARGDFKEMLKCIRCGACLNVCPIYGVIGGHAYGATYPGPMGIVYTTLLNGLEAAHPLLDATTLCGACADVCPVKVPLPRLLHGMRELRAKRRLTPLVEQKSMAGYGSVVSRPGLFRLGQKFARLVWPLARPATGGRIMDRVPIPAAKPFRRRIK